MSPSGLVNGVHIHYEKVGDGENIILLLPGVAGSAKRHFGPQLENLDREKLTIIAMDPRGQGESRPPNRDCPADFLYRDAEDAAALMQELGFDKYSIFGWSDGANSAAILGARYPERVKKLIMLGGNSYNSKTDFAVLENIKKEVSSTKDLSQLKLCEDYDKAVTLDWLNTLLTVHQRDENGEADLFKNELPKITADTLIIHGDNDEYVPLFHAEYFHKHIKNSRLIIWKDGTHDLHLQLPDKFNKVLQEFILG